MNYQEAITRLIVEPIQGDGVEDARAAYDVDAIADKVLTDDGEGNYFSAPGFGGIEYFEDGTPDDAASDAGVEAFWDVVRDHAL